MVKINAYHLIVQPLDVSPPEMFTCLLWGINLEEVEYFSDLTQYVWKRLIVS